MTKSLNVNQLREFRFVEMNSGVTSKKLSSFSKCRNLLTTNIEFHTYHQTNSQIIQIIKITNRQLKSVNSKLKLSIRKILTGRSIDLHRDSNSSSN